MAAAAGPGRPPALEPRLRGAPGGLAGAGAAGPVLCGGEAAGRGGAGGAAEGSARGGGGGAIAARAAEGGQLRRVCESGVYCVPAGSAAWLLCR